MSHTIQVTSCTGCPFLHVHESDMGRYSDYRCNLKHSLARQRQKAELFNQCPLKSGPVTVELPHSLMPPVSQELIDLLNERGKVPFTHPRDEK